MKRSSMISQLIVALSLLIAARVALSFTSVFTSYTQIAVSWYEQLGKNIARFVPGGSDRPDVFYSLNGYPVAEADKYRPRIAIPFGDSFRQTADIAIYQGLLDLGEGLIITIFILAVACCVTLLFRTFIGTPFSREWSLCSYMAASWILLSATRLLVVCTITLSFHNVTAYTIVSAYEVLSTSHVKLFWGEVDVGPLSSRSFPALIALTPASMGLLAANFAIGALLCWLCWESRSWRKYVIARWAQLPDSARGCGLCGYPARSFPCPECGNHNPKLVDPYRRIGSSSLGLRALFSMPVLLSVAVVICFVGALAPFLFGWYLARLA